MTKNVKIALGCGGAGCLGLIVIGVASVLLYFFMGRAGGNHNSNSNSSYNRNANLSTNRNSNGSSSSSNGSSSSMSEDDKHKLYQAATMTGDQAVIRRVSVKLGLMNEDFTPGDEYLTFVKDHVVWAFSNGDFIQSINTKEKALAYVNQNFPE